MESQLDLGKGFLWEKFQPSGGDADGSQVMGQQVVVEKKRVNGENFKKIDSEREEKIQKLGEVTDGKGFYLKKVLII